MLLAKQHGVTMLDTARAYGEAEEILGKLNAVSIGFDIITKTIPLRSSAMSRNDVELVSGVFRESLESLKSDRVYGLLVYTPENLLCPSGSLLWQKLKEFKDEKVVSKIGVSVYHPQQLEEILNRYDIDLVQAPCNIYDQRFTLNALFKRLKENCIEVHTRSVFLQGLLLMKPNDLPEQFKPLRKHHVKFHNHLDEIGMTPLQACLSYGFNQSDIDKTVIGVETVSQLMEVFSCAANSFNRLPSLEAYSLNNERFVDPSMWQK